MREDCKTRNDTVHLYFNTLKGVFNLMCYLCWWPFGDLTLHDESLSITDYKSNGNIKIRVTKMFIIPVTELLLVPIRCLI